LGHPCKFQRVSHLGSITARHLVVGISQTLQHRTEGATYVRQGDHHVGHWPTFWFGHVCMYVCKRSVRSLDCVIGNRFAALNRGRHLCSAGRPSRWALAHVLVWSCMYVCKRSVRSLACVIVNRLPLKIRVCTAFQSFKHHSSVRPFSWTTHPALYLPI